MEENKKVNSRKIKLSTLGVIIINIIAIIFLILTYLDYINTPVGGVALPSLEEEKRQFNEQLSIYAGKSNYSKVKQLVKTVNYKNTISNMKVTLIGEMIVEEDLNCYKYISNNKLSDKCKIQMRYNDDGIIDYITIYNFDEEITEYEINKPIVKENVQVKKESIFDNLIEKLVKFFRYLFCFPEILGYLIVFIFYKLKKKNIIKTYKEEKQVKEINTLKDYTKIALFIIPIIIIFHNFLIITNNVGL